MRLSDVRRAVSLAMGCAAALVFSSASWGLDVDHFASSSKLASGNWVKVQVTEEGIYEITADELAELGFSDISKVKMFGRSAKVMTEVLDDTEFDDLEQIPTAIFDDKLCFYGGDVYTLSYAKYSNYLYVDMTNNSYSTSSYYFLTDSDDYDAFDVTICENDTTVTDTRTDSYAIIHHEEEVCSPALSGKTMVGESFDTNQELTFDLTLPHFKTDTRLQWYIDAMAKSTAKATLNLDFTTDYKTYSASFSGTTNRMSGTTDQYYYYTTCTGRGYRSSVLSSDGELSLKFFITSDGTISVAYLDNFTLTYRQTNVLEADSSQLQMFFENAYITCSKIINVEGATSSMVVWHIADDYNISQYPMVDMDDETGAYFSPGLSNDLDEFILFDPSRTLKKIVSSEVVENQNLHAMDVPDMLIITQPGLLEQAQRLADLHAEHDGMDVAVVEQDKIFNEFSMGAPDAMAIRVFAKMLYARDPEKFQYLLMFGDGSYDNRKIIGTYSDNMLLTFQSDNSYIATSTYVTDSFFGMLDDNPSSTTISKIPVTICTGRIPAQTAEEAAVVVDKIIEYTNARDYGAWQHRILVISDEGDSDLHLYQSEEITAVIRDTDLEPVVHKAYVDMFEQNSDGYSIEGREHIADEFQRGVLLSTFIGHGGPKYLGKTAHIYSTEKVKATDYSNLPFMTFATCDVGRFDSEERGIAEQMLFKEDGGHVGCVASARTVYAVQNHVTNVYFMQSLLNLNEDGTQPTVGYAYAQAHRNWGTSSSVNRLDYNLLGDPAMKLNYPIDVVDVTSIGGTDITAGDTATIYPMTQIVVAGKVKTIDGEDDASFNGDVTVTLHDKQIYFGTVDYEEPSFDVYYQRDELNTANGRVTDGEFEVTLLVPDGCMASDEGVMISVYAIGDDSEYAVSGISECVKMGAYDEESAIVDDNPPVIEAMYLNDSTFVNGDRVLVDPLLHVTITDDYGICTSTSAIANALSLVLDGSTSYSESRNIVNLSQSGCYATINLTVSDLTYGSHSLTLSVCDFAGNCTTETIDFFVYSTIADADVTATESVVRQSATFEVTHEFTAEPTTTLFVLNQAGETVWSGSFTDSEYTWDLTDNDGDRVASGLYRYYGILAGDGEYGGSPMQTLVVLDTDAE